MTKKRWQDEDHIFNPPNITRFEFIVTVDVKQTIARPCNGKRFKPRKPRDGKVLIIIPNKEGGE